MRVLWVVKGLGPGGAERLLVEAARVHDAARVQLTCAYVLPWKDHLVGELEAAGVRCVCLAGGRRDGRGWPRRLRRLLLTGDAGPGGRKPDDHGPDHSGPAFDVVHGHSPLPIAVARLVVRTLPRGRRPVTMSTEHNGWRTHRLPTRWLNRLTARWDVATYAVSAEVADSMRGPAAARVVTLVHGIDVAAVGAQRAHRDEVRRELGLDRIATGQPDDVVVVVGTVANFRPQKDYPNLLQAMKLLRDRAVPVHLVAVGQGPQEAETRALAVELGVDRMVTFTGFRSDAQRVLAACDVFTLASQWEGLPVALMEALALGLPVVATAVGGVEETFRERGRSGTGGDGDAEQALLVPPRDPEALAGALARVATDHGLRTRLGAASLARAQEFDVRRAVRDIEDTYVRVAAARGVPGSHPAAVAEAPAAAPARVRATPDIRPATLGDREAILSLLGRSLGGGDDPRLAALFAWKHDTNRFGPSPTWVATDGPDGPVIAVRAFMRWEFERGGRVLRAVRAVDTATDPDHQGKGLFTALTLHGLEAVRAEGVDFVFNTPNDQSRPGYLKMDWRVVGHLPAAAAFTGVRSAVRAVRSRVPADRWSIDPEQLGCTDLGVPIDEWLAGDGPARYAQRSRTSAGTVDVRELRTRVDHDFLSWRYGLDLLHYRVVEDVVEGGGGGSAAVVVRLRRRGAATELVVADGFGPPAAVDRLARRTARRAGAHYAIRLGAGRPSTRFMPLPGGGPVLTWRAVNDHGMPPLTNWALTLGDVELF